MATTPSFDLFLDTLQQKALAFGASDAKVIPASQIPVEDDIILFCKDPLCDSYGQSIHCPPHAMAPQSMRAVIGNYQKALIFKLELPSEQLLDESCNLHFKKIFRIAAKLEQAALAAGYTESSGYAAGSCKPVFCPSYKCQALRDGTSCRYPAEARPSMEAVGINVFKLYENVGWEIHKITKNNFAPGVTGGVLGGLVLVG
jgi:predicted metal-binding protein